LLRAAYVRPYDDLEPVIKDYDEAVESSNDRGVEALLIDAIRRCISVPGR
jgi:hypothetical protein